MQLLIRQLTRAAVAPANFDNCQLCQGIQAAGVIIPITLSLRHTRRPPLDKLSGTIIDGVLSIPGQALGLVESVYHAYRGVNRPEAMARKLTPFEQLRAFAKAFPEAHEDFPWGESAIKVRGKVFLFMRNDDKGLGLSVKLPVSRYFALEYPFTAPTGYGLGKSGWVTCSFAPRDTPPLDVLQAWIDESYRAVAPKKLAATLPPSATKSNLK